MYELSHQAKKYDFKLTEKELRKNEPLDLSSGVGLRLQFSKVKIRELHFQRSPRSYAAKLKNRHFYVINYQSRPSYHAFCTSLILIQYIIPGCTPFPLWKYTLGLLLSVGSKVVQTFPSSGWRNTPPAKEKREDKLNNVYLRSARFSPRCQALYLG